MLTLKDLNVILNELLPENGIVDFCPNGLQVEGKEIISSIATAVSASLSTIEEAIRRKVDVLIVHHGIFWNRDSYLIKGTKKNKISLLLNHEISLFSYHLPLDFNLSIGNNWKAAKDLGWTDLKPFSYMNKIPIGVKGTVAPISKEDLKNQLENYYQHPATSVWGGKDVVKTIALVSGGAHKTILEAADEGIDAFVTGSFDEPTWHQAMEEKINFYALGHSATERVGPIALRNRLKELLDIPVDFIDINNPF